MGMGVFVPTSILFGFKKSFNLFTYCFFYVILSMNLITKIDLFNCEKVTHAVGRVEDNRGNKQANKTSKQNKQANKTDKQTKQT